MCQSLRGIGGSAAKPAFHLGAAHVEAQERDIRRPGTRSINAAVDYGIVSLSEGGSWSMAPLLALPLVANIV